MGKKKRARSEAAKFANKPSKTSDSQSRLSFMFLAFLPYMMFIMLLAGISLRLVNLGNVADRSPDEGRYTYQANELVRYGPERLKSMISDFNRDPNSWTLPMPHRVGYLWPVALVMKVTGITDARAGAYVSCFFSILSLILLVVLGLRFFNPCITAGALLFMSVSPMDLALARRAWQDAAVGFFALFLTYLSCEIIRAPKKIFLYVLFAMAGCYGMLIKESVLVFYGLCVLWIIYVLAVRKKMYFSSVLLIFSAAAGAGLAVFVLNSISGGISNVMESLGRFGSIINTAPYALEYCSGPWYQFVKGLFILTPVCTVLCIAAIMAVLFFRELKLDFIEKSSDFVYGFIFVMLSYLVVSTVIPNMKNLRYVSLIYGQFYIASAMGIWYIAVLSSEKYRSFVSACLIVLALTAAFFDYGAFKAIIVRTELKDLSIVLLEKANENVRKHERR